MGQRAVCFSQEICVCLKISPADRTHARTLCANRNRHTTSSSTFCRVSKVLGAATSGYMNDFEALPQEQVSALRLLMQTSEEACSWADDAVEYLVRAGCYRESAEEAADLPQLAAPKRASNDDGNQSVSKRRGRGVTCSFLYDLV